MVSGVITETIMVQQRASSEQSSLMENTSSESLATKQVECINIDDDDDDSMHEMEGPPTKKQRLEDDLDCPDIIEPLDVGDHPEPSMPEVQKSPELNNVDKKEGVIEEEKVDSASNGGEQVKMTYEHLLDEVNIHVGKELEARKGLGRKLMDVMLAAINREVSKDPMAIKDLIVKKMLVLPNTISHPPSQVLQMIIEHDPDETLSRLITKLFGDIKVKETDQERKEKMHFKRDFPNATMTRLVAQIGHDLVQEHTYGDIVHARNLPELPKDIEGYKRVAEQLKPVWQNLKEKNQQFKTKYHTCRVCRFKTDSLIAYSKHTWILHHDGKRFNCTMCPEFDNSEFRMKRHYIENHAVVPMPKEEIQTRLDCPICDADFKYKGELQTHFKECKRQFSTVRRMLQPKDEDQLMINRWLWAQPAQEPSVAKKQLPPPPKPVLRSIRSSIPAMTNRNIPITHSKPITKPAPVQQQTAAANHQVLSKLLPLLATLSNNPQALEKIKTEQPEVFRQLQGQFNSIRNNPEAMAKIQRMQAQKNIIRPSSSVTSQPRLPVKKVPPPPRVNIPQTTLPKITMTCEICDNTIDGKMKYLEHMQATHKKLLNKTLSDMNAGAPLACSRCQHRFWCYDGLERHLVMKHGLVTQEFLRKAQAKEDGGRCQICKKQYAFNMLQHLVQEHSMNLCSAEIRYSCDVCHYACTNYQDLEKHLADVHPKTPNSRS